jgi:hypothetical protein
MSFAKIKPAPDDFFDLDACVAAELTPFPIPPLRGTPLERELLERVRRSALAHRGLSTVRREDGRWTTVAPGLRRRALSAAGGMHVDVVKADPHVSIPWSRDALAQETLVVDGTLGVEPDGAPPRLLNALDQVVMGQDTAWRQTAGEEGATLYVRRRTLGLECLPEAEARWWAAAQDASAADAAPACAWSAFMEGVEAAVLQAHGDVASMLVRIAAGAALPDHAHSLDEDCFMLAGDMFLGDILMRAGDYQLARAGGRHVGISSDMGGLFYFHGAVPPAASELA